MRLWQKAPPAPVGEVRTARSDRTGTSYCSVRLPVPSARVAAAAMSVTSHIVAPGAQAGPERRRLAIGPSARLIA